VGVELKPLGVTCNIQCHYCYQNPLRDAGHRSAYDLEAMKAAVLREGVPFSLFGGEALLVPKADLEALWSWGLEKFGRNGIQTNGTLIDDEHIALFRKYQVDIGISIDGPGMLNDARWSASLEKTREATARTQAAIETLCREGMPPGLIVTLHRANASADRMPALCDWFRHLDRIGVRHARLHELQVDSPAVREAYALTSDESVEAMLRLHELERAGLATLRFDIFSDMRELLLGRDEKTACTWNACDPLATQAVRAVEGDGQATNCSRTDKEGIDFVKADSAGFERYVALYRTPQEQGGCRDCRFFLMCKGQCPGTAIDGDWRNRSESCPVWMRLYEHVERELLDAGETPLSLRQERRAVEEIFVRRWESGRNTRLAAALAHVAQQPPAAPQEPAAAPVMPDFKRVAWASDGARAVWEPRLQRIAAAWSEVEGLSVEAGLRACAIVHGKKHDDFRVAAASPETLAMLTRALEQNDAPALSALLGVPACCSEHSRMMAAAPVLDPTWTTVSASRLRARTARTLDVEGPWQTNILWRWLGLCALPHLPCSLDCLPSRELAGRLLALGREAGYGEEMDWMREILSWPVEWTAWHGVAIVATPILKISTRTDATGEKLAVRRHGAAYPAQGATGLRFPYRRKGTIRFTTSRAFRAGVEHALSSRGACP
jgi:uncharacterized protein